MEKVTETIPVSLLKFSGFNQTISTPFVISLRSLFIQFLIVNSEPEILILSILVKQKGGLVLTKLKSITDSQARIFASHNGTLNIYGVKTLSDAQKNAP